MGVRTGAIAVTSLLACAVGCAVLVPGAAAEVREEDRCGLLPAAIQPLPVWEFEPQEAWTPPEAGFTYSPPLQTTPPPSAFTATASWGDGTSTPVAVEAPWSGCYRLSHPSHSYPSPGLYTFSYDVFDSHGALDFVLGQHQVRIWDPTPQLLSGPARTLHPTVGVPWSLVVGEFSVESPWGSFYTAAIEPEPGVRQPATVTGEHDRLVVSTTLTYSQPFTGTVGVVLSRAKGAPVGTWQVLDVRARLLARVRIHGRPLLVAGSPGHDELVFRLNGSLPQPRRAHVNATIEAAGETRPVAAFGRHRAVHCYDAVLDAASVNPALSAGRLPFTLVVGAQGLAQREGGAFPLPTSARVAGRRLGC